MLSTHRAEFDGVRAEQLPVWIDQVLHRAVVEVNEEGTGGSGSYGRVRSPFGSKIQPYTASLSNDRRSPVLRRDPR